jgi:CHAD domain-containing protein
MSDTEQNAGESAAHEGKLLGITQKRLEKFVSLFAKVVVNDQPETIHDARVWSRRLQEVFRVLFPKPRSNKSRKLVRTLRQVRRTLGDCRNLDVTIGLIESKLTGASAPKAHESWDLIKNYLRDKRSLEFARAREELTGHDIMQFATRTRSLLQSESLQKEPEELLERSVEAAFLDWNEALRETKENPQVDQIHGLRIAGKRLRYRVELLKDLGYDSAKPQIKTLKRLQDELGDWHDRQVLLQFVAEFIGRPAFLVNHPDAGRVLLAEMERERRRNEAAVTAILRSAEKTREAWVPMPEQT